MPQNDKRMLSKAVEKYKGIFSPKCQGFNILECNVENFVTLSKLFWKYIYELTTIVEVEKGEQEKDKTTKKDTIEDKGDTLEEDAQDVQGVNVLSTSLLHAMKESQKDFLTIEDIPNKST